MVGCEPTKSRKGKYLFIDLLSLTIFCIRVLCMYVCTCIMCMPGAYRNQKRPSDSLEMSKRWLWAALCTLGTEPGSFVFNYWAISSVPFINWWTLCLSYLGPSIQQGLISTVDGQVSRGLAGVTKHDWEVTFSVFRAWYPSGLLWSWLFSKVIFSIKTKALFSKS